MKCRNLSSTSPFVRGLHQLICSECRRAKQVDNQIARGTRQLRQQNASVRGLEETLALVRQTEANGTGSMPFSMGLAHRRARFLHPRYLPLTIKLAGGLLLSVGAWWHYANLEPNIVVPSPTMPNPNGYDALVKAGNILERIEKADSIAQKAATRPSASAQAVAKRLSLSSAISNAMMTPEQAKKEQLRRNPKGLPQSVAPEDKIYYTFAEKHALFAKVKPALDAARDSLAIPVFLNPPWRSFKAIFPEFAQFRGLARAFALEAQVNIERKDYHSAMQSLLNCIEMGSRVPQGGSLLASLVGIAIQAIGRSKMEEILPHLHGRELEYAAKRMEQIVQQRTEFHKTLTEAKYASQAGLMELLSTPNWRTSMFSTMGLDGTNQPDSAAFAKSIPLYFISKRTILGNYTRFMDKKVLEAQNALDNPTAQMWREDTSLQGLDPITAMLTPVFSHAHFIEFYNTAMNRLLMTRLALRVYLEWTGKYPDSLKDLRGAYLRDPFAPSRLLGYQKRGDSYLLYSVGPDCVDDNGKPATNPDATNPNSRRERPPSKPNLYKVSPQSKGDIVAGIHEAHRNDD